MGNSPFFVKACLENFFQTSGVQDVDFHLLTVDPVSKDFLEAVEKARSTYQFSFHVHPFGRKRDKAHMNLLDWAVANLELADWTYVTHSDMFWLDEGWLSELIAIQAPGIVGYMMPYSQYRGDYEYVHQKYSFSGKPLVRAHDFAGLYHIPTLKSRNLKFKCGFLDTEIPISDKLREAVISGKLRWIRQHRPVVIGDMMDGSDIIGLELAGSIIEPPLKARFCHGWDTLGLGDDIERDGDTLKVCRLMRQCHRGLPSYAWISSFLLDRHTSQVIFPWAMFLKIAEKTGYYTNKSIFCNTLERYADPGASPIGAYDFFGIKKVKFLDGEI